ncbi:MAG: hypothetical protein ABI772_05350 [Bacteroidota bacterium]
MLKLQEIIFKVTESNYGTQSPLIKDGTILILIQDGDARFVKYHEATIENPFPTFSHPKNGDILKNIALEIINQNNPNHLDSDKALLFICPEEYLDKLMW